MALATYQWKFLNVAFKELLQWFRIAFPWSWMTRVNTIYKVMMEIKTAEHILTYGSKAELSSKYDGSFISQIATDSI